MLNQRTEAKKSLLQYEMPIQAPKIDFVRKDITMEEANSSAITRDILNSILPPRQFERDNVCLIQYVSALPATRTDVVKTQSQLDKALKINGALETGLCPIRSELYSQCFDELIRQVTIDCSLRGLMLVRLRNEIQMTINSYKSIYESALNWGVKKTGIEEDHKISMSVENDCLRKEIEQQRKMNEFLEEKITKTKKENEEMNENLEKKWRAEIEKLKNDIAQIREHLKQALVSK